MSAAVPFAAAGVRGFLHRPDAGIGAGLVLAHGAGSDCNAPLLIAAAGAFAAAGLLALRIDLPFRQKRPKGPPSPAGAAADRAGLADAAAAMRRLVPGRVVLGGASYGGRQATMLAADHEGVAEALLLLSYPLHPPGKPEQLRTGHFPRLHVPCVFVQGGADPFGTPAELRGALPAIPASCELVPVERAGHDLKRGKVAFEPVVAAVLQQLAA